MKKINWNIDKNIKLIAERDISFEDIIYNINKGNLIEIIDNPFIQYKDQKVFILNINNYIYYVPFVENNEEIFLKTIIPSRKLTKKYLGK